MTEKEKLARECVILALQAAQKMIKAVSGASATLKEASKAIEKIVRQLSDEAPAC